MFKKILVANRGEIAVRIMRTAEEMGVKTVAVYSEADRRALHVLNGDETYFLGEADPLSSYLNIDKIIQAAKECGAEAIHPGYGFLAENSTFANRVAEEGLVFIGPPGDVLARVGDKTQARRIMAKCNVPIIPGMTASEADPDKLAKAAEEMGYPVLIKASAGGGGKGMRIVASPEQIGEAASLAASEALGAFGDGSIYLEKYLEKPRHVEFQILGDTHGNVVHLFERECSVQRRHQKIIEETPSPALTENLRARMSEAALAAARASGYVNAGTVEFLLDRNGEFYFLEVNARLQVEHPITEMTTGMDLVRRQLEVAAGEPLPFTQEEISRKGHAIECRIYAEDAEADFMPSPGRILYVRSAEGPGVRYDHGLYSGFEVPVQYDPILAKLIVWAEDRPSACDRMVRALKESVVLGVKTPIEFLIDVVSSEAFRSGETHTHFIEDNFSHWRPNTAGDVTAALVFTVNEMLGIRQLSASGNVSERSELPSPWQTLGSWQLVKQ
jgi:acetyl-CoA carboxylase biotin carboxylase subunit